MNPREVHDAVRDGRAVQSHRYHAGKRGLAFAEVLAALERCYHVAPDPREQEGGRKHPAGWYAFANLPYKRRLRIDFDVLEDEPGTLLLVVTAYDA